MIKITALIRYGRNEPQSLWGYFPRKKKKIVRYILLRHYDTISFQLLLLLELLLEEDTDGLGTLSFGPHTRIVKSSETETNICGYTGFQDTQLTVRVWPVSVAIGISFLMCQMYTRLSSLPLAMKLWFDPPKLECIVKCPWVTPWNRRTRHRSFKSHKCTPWLATFSNANLSFLSTVNDIMGWSSCSLQWQDR